MVDTTKPTLRLKPNTDKDVAADTTQHGSGWTGILVIKGNLDIAPLYRPAVEMASNYSVVCGDTATGEMHYKLFDNTLTKEVAIAHIATTMPVRPYSMLISGDIPISVNVPVRNTTMNLWSQGHSANGFNSMLDAVAQLNRTPIDETANYTELMRSKVFGPQSGKYAVCLGYFSRHPRIVLSTRQMELYAWVVFYNGVYTFIFSTNKNYVELIKQGLDTSRRNDVFALPVELSSNSVTVIHPLYWITKFNKVFNTMKTAGSKLTITTYFREYILRNTQSLVDSTHL
jgi:hypothetical protein